MGDLHHILVVQTCFELVAHTILIKPINITLNQLMPMSKL